MTEVVNFHVCKRLAVSATLGCDFCDRFVKWVYPKTCLVVLIDALTVPIVRHCGKQQLEVTKNTKVVSFPRRGRLVTPKMQSTQRVGVSPFSQAMVVVQTERKGPILDKPKQPTVKRME